jgi:hypothetical protein
MDQEINNIYVVVRVRYSIAEADANLLDKFEINGDTGVITTKVEFDRYRF